MSNHPSRSRAQFYGVRRLHARPYRVSRGHGVAVADPWRSQQHQQTRSYFQRVRELFERTRIQRAGDR